MRYLWTKFNIKNKIDLYQLKIGKIIASQCNKIKDLLKICN